MEKDEKAGDGDKPKIPDNVAKNFICTIFDVTCEMNE